jgi:hypothetical protein
LEVIEHDKILVLVPAKHISTDQGWDYTEAWQRMLQEAFEGLKRGAVAGPFASAEELIADLWS